MGHLHRTPETGYFGVLLPVHLQIAAAFPFLSVSPSPQECEELVGFQAQVLGETLAKHRALSVRILEAEWRCDPVPNMEDTGVTARPHEDTRGPETFGRKQKEK